MTNVHQLVLPERDRTVALAGRAEARMAAEVVILPCVRRERLGVEPLTGVSVRCAGLRVVDCAS